MPRGYCAQRKGRAATNAARPREDASASLCCRCSAVLTILIVVAGLVLAVPVVVLTGLAALLVLLFLLAALITLAGVAIAEMTTAFDLLPYAFHATLKPG